MRKTHLRRTLMYLMVFTLVLSTAPMSFHAPARAAGIAAPVTANWDTTYQEMDGVGAAYAYTDSIQMLMLGSAGHQDTVRHLLDLTFSEKNGTGHDIVRVIIGDGPATASGTAASPGFNPVTGLPADTGNPGFDTGGNPIPMKGTSGQYGYKIGSWNRIYDGQTDSIWPNEPEHVPGTLVPVQGFAWDYPSWNQPIANDEGGYTNLLSEPGSDPVVIKDGPRTRKELFDVDQIWTMRQAMQYGVKQFYACMWEAPYWMSNSNNSPSKIIRGDTATIDGKTVKIYYQAYADYLVNYIKGMWEQWGIPITHINPFNEVDLASGGSTAYVTEVINSYVGPTLKKALEPGGALDGITNPDGRVIDFVPQLCAVDGTNLSASINRGGTIFSMTDPDTGSPKNPYLDVFTTHLYGTVNIGTNETVLNHSGDFATRPLDWTTDTSKYPEYLNRYKLWQAEFMNQDTGDGSAGAYTQRYGNQNINDAVRYANLLTNMFCSNPGFSGYVWWSMWDNNGADGSDLIRFASTNSQQNAGHVGTLTGEYRTFKRFYGFGHFSRFLKPGDVRFDVTRAPAANLNIVGFKSPDNSDFSITVTNGNNDDSLQPLEFSLNDFPADITSVTVFRTSASENQKKIGTIPVIDGKFIIDIPSASIVTIVPSNGEYATYDGLDGERDIFSSLEAEGNDNGIAGDTAGDAGRANEAVQLSDSGYLAYKNINFAEGSANGGVVRRHLLYLTAQARAASGGSLLAYVLPVGSAVESVADIRANGVKVAEILVPGSETFGKYQSMVDTGDLSAYGHKDLYIVASTNAATDPIIVDRFLFGANDSDWSSSANNSTVSIPGNIVVNGDFETATAASTSNWSAGRYDGGTFVQSITGPSLSASEIQRYTGYSRYLKNSSTSANAASAKLPSRIDAGGQYDGLWQDVTGRMTRGERYRFEGYFLSLQNGPLGYEIAADNPGDVKAALVYYDGSGNQLAIRTIGGRDMPEPYAEREAGERAWWNGNTLIGSILQGGPLGVTSFQPVKVKVADWHESTSEPFIYEEPEDTAKVVLAIYAEDSNILYTDLVSIVPVPDREALRAAYREYSGENNNLLDVVRAALANSSLTQKVVASLVKALEEDFYAERAASLVSLKVDGIEVSGFMPDKYDYAVKYPVNATPQVTAVPFDSKANVDITAVAATPGQATVTVTNAEMQAVYTIDFTADTELVGIDINGLPLVSFTSNQYSYIVRVPEGMQTVPVVTGIAKDPGVSVAVNQAETIPGQATVIVGYGSSQTTYTVNFVYDATGSDEFDQPVLNLSLWKWVNEDPETWSLTASPGYMMINTRKGDIYGTATDMRNILLQDAPGDWTIETKLTTSKVPNVAYQQGGLLVFQDMDNYLKLDWEATSSTATRIQVVREVNGSVSATSINGNIVNRDTMTLWLRVNKSGNIYKTYYSVDGITFTQLGNDFTLNFNNVMAGLTASNGGGTETTDFNVFFDYFHTTAKAGELLMDKAELIEWINRALALIEADYTAESWAFMQNALVEAIAVKDSVNQSQLEVDEAVEELQAAIDGLVPARPVVGLTGSSTVLPGETFTVGLSLNNLENTLPATVYAQDITLSYDSEIFEYLGSAGVADGAQIIETDDSVPGSIRLIGASIGGVTGENTRIMEVSFKAKENVLTGTGIIAVTKAELGIMPEGMVVQAGLMSKTITVSPAPVDKSALSAAITLAQNLYNSAVTGTEAGQYWASDKLAFHAAIDAAGVIHAKADATQLEVDNATAALNAAIAAFESSVISASTGDLNHNATIDVGDLAIAAYYYNATSADSNWPEAMVADINKDGVVSIEDLAFIAMRILQ